MLLRLQTFHSSCECVVKIKFLLNVYLHKGKNNSLRTLLGEGHSRGLVLHTIGRDFLSSLHHTGEMWPRCEMNHLQKQFRSTSYSLSHNNKRSNVIVGLSRLHELARSFVSFPECLPGLMPSCVAKQLTSFVVKRYLVDVSLEGTFIAPDYAT